MVIYSVNSGFDELKLNPNKRHFKFAETKEWEFKSGIKIFSKKYKASREYYLLFISARTWSLTLNQHFLKKKQGIQQDFTISK